MANNILTGGGVVLEAHGGDHVYEEGIAPFPELGVLVDELTANKNTINP